MLVDKSKCGFVRPMKAHKESRQVAALRAAGAGVLYIVGKDGVTGWQQVAASRRKGDVVMVEALCLLASPKSKSVRWPSQDLRDALEAIEARGASVWETHTGLRSTDPAQRRTMIQEAVRALGAGQRSLPSDQARANGARGGRRPKQFPPEIVEKARRVWESRKHKTYKECAAALPPGFSAMRAFRMFGPRG